MRPAAPTSIRSRMSGCVARAKRAVNQKHAPVPAALTLEGDRAACRDAGMDDFLTKPLRIDDLRVVLDRWLLSA
jgi:CheY-like chemotaxis protein